MFCTAIRAFARRRAFLRDGMLVPKPVQRLSNIREIARQYLMVDIDLIMIALLSETEEKEIEFISEAESRKIKRTFWVHELWKKRHVLGEFKTLCSNDLCLDPRYFYDYYKMGLD